MHVDCLSLNQYYINLIYSRNLNIIMTQNKLYIVKNLAWDHMMSTCSNG